LKTTSLFCEPCSEKGKSPPAKQGGEKEKEKKRVGSDYGS